MTRNLEARRPDTGLPDSDQEKAMKNDRPVFKRAVRTEDRLLLQDLQVLRRLEGVIDLLEAHDTCPAHETPSWLGSLRAQFGAGQRPTL